MPIPQSYLDELVARSDIVDVVSDYVQLTKRSGSNLFGICPFHSEKTPSFAVRPSQQTYHCFGCGKGGGVINFIMEIENLRYPDAVAVLARRAGMPPPEDDTPSEVRSRRERLLSLNKAAARHFHANLSKPVGGAAVEYMRRRGISPPVATRFGLGAAADEWQDLSDAMRSAGYSEAELIDAGLAKRGQRGGIYDVFRNRLVFPVIDVRGSVIGFSGRILGDGEPKYLNTPDTPVFSKSRNLFALNLAKKTKLPQLILAEGNVDVVSLHQAGFDCAVASLGTALTQEQARLMKHYTENVVIAYDSDAAGVKAAQRAIPILEAAGLSVRVLRMEGAKDPDEFIKKNGPDAFGLLLDRSAGRVDYQLDAIRAKYDLESSDGRLDFIREAVEILVGLPPVRRDVYAGRAAELANVSKESVLLEVRRAYAKRKKAEKTKLDRAAMRPDAAIQPVGRSIRYDNPVSARAEEGLVQLLLFDPALADRVKLTEEDFSSPFLAKLYGEIKKRISGGEAVTAAALLTSLSGDEASQLTRLQERPVSTANAEQALDDYIARIVSEASKRAPDGDKTRYLEIMMQKKKGFGG